MTQYFVYGRDGAESYDVKVRLTEEHWTFMDGYAAELIARGPTLTPDRSRPTGSLHIVDLPSPEGLQRFVYAEPYYLGGAFASVEVYRFENLTARTMWDFATPVAGYDRFLVLTKDAARPLSSDHLIVYGNLYDHAREVGRAGLVEAPSAEAARALLESADAEVHPWEFGGRR